MTTTALIVAWWFLVTPVNSAHQIQGQETDPGYPQQSAIPLALGPYPTPEMCRVAEHLVAPNDQRFWNAAEATQWKDYNAKLAVYKAAYDAGQKRYLDRMEQLAKENPKPGKYFLPDGTTFEVWGAGTIFRSDGGTNSGPYAMSDQLRDRMEPAANSRPTAPDWLGEDSYEVKTPCAPVKGWYAAQGVKQ